VKKGPPRDMAASVRQRLMSYARAHDEAFQAVLQRYAAERLLYRLSLSPEADQYLLKGALLFLVWSETPFRTTRDIDLLGYGDPAVAPQAALLRSLSDMPVPDDGIAFLADTVRAVPIREDSIYGGVRVTLTACLENARIPLQVDVGFGDAITPPPENVAFPVLLDFPAPRLRAYPPETVIAEKLQALVVLEMGNSRMKDFYDLYTLGRQFAFSGERLRQAVAATFGRRGTAVPSDTPAGLTARFAGDVAKLAQWDAFLRRQRLTAQDLPLAEVVAFLGGFLVPVLQTVREQKRFDARWGEGGPWK
jgi:hypothetical protein